MTNVNCYSAVDVNWVPAIYADGEYALVSVINSALYCWNMNLEKELELTLKI